MKPRRGSKWGRRAISVLAVCFLTACGGDDDDSQKDDEPVSTIKNGELPCGASSCKPYNDLPGARACCKDAFTGTCGVQLRSFDDCREPPTLDDRCKLPDAVEMQIFAGREAAYGCCTSNNECGM